MTINDIKQIFCSWLISKDGGNKTIKTANEYMRRINRICDKLYSKRGSKEWGQLLNDMYPVLFIYTLCAKKWNSPEKIKIEASYDYLLNGDFISQQDKKVLRSDCFRKYLKYVWENKKERFKEQVSIYSLCDFVRQTNYAALQTTFTHIVDQEIKRIENISTSVLSFEYIEATKTTPMRLLSKNEEKFLNSNDLVYFFKCSRNTIQNLLNRGEIHYSSKCLYSLQDINEYLAKKHSDYIKSQNKKLPKKEKATDCEHIREILLLYGFYRQFVNQENFDKFLNQDNNINDHDDLLIRNNIVTTLKFFKQHRKNLDNLNLDDDFIALASFFYEKEETLPKFEKDWFPQFIKLLVEYSNYIHDNDTDNAQEKIISYLNAVTEYIEVTLKQLKKKRWITLDEAKEETKLSKKTIQGLRERHKITYTQYSKKVIKYLKSDIEKIKEERDS